MLKKLAVKLGLDKVMAHFVSQGWIRSSEVESVKAFFKGILYAILHLDTGEALPKTYKPASSEVRAFSVDSSPTKLRRPSKDIKTPGRRSRDKLSVSRKNHK